MLKHKSLRRFVPDLLFRQLTLYPKWLTCDVWICSDHLKLCQGLSKAYGGSVEYYSGAITKPCVCFIEVKGKEKIVCCLFNFYEPVVVHEAVHISWKVESIIRYNWKPGNEETQAYMVDHIFTEIMEMKEDRAKYKIDTEQWKNLPSLSTPATEAVTQTADT